MEWFGTYQRVAKGQVYTSRDGILHGLPIEMDYLSALPIYSMATKIHKGIYPLIICEFVQYYSTPLLLTYTLLNVGLEENFITYESSI